MSLPRTSASVGPAGALAPARLTATAARLASLLHLARRRIGALFRAANRGLLVELVRTGFKVADHNSIAGALWSLLAPFIMLTALYLVFRDRFGEELRAYPLYLLLGISFVNYFSSATRDLIIVLFGNRALLLNTTVPRETVFLSQIAFHSYKLLVEVVLGPDPRMRQRAPGIGDQATTASGTARASPQPGRGGGRESSNQNRYLAPQLCAKQQLRGYAEGS